MTTTLQQQPVTGPNPQLKRMVYSKYREMLGSYNDKANTIIQTLPEYLVHEDKGFNITSLVENPRDGYGAPPPPPPPVMGNIPATRLQTQMRPEPPACVQNAMMTKDKKPFTYTPMGIDLSQIKSPRMAKRISRNANSEGVTGVPKMSPLAQQPNIPGVQPPTPPVLPSGMPVQVFPCGPPQPPPPPPPQAKLNTAPQNGSINGNKSPDRRSPQSFEPPPFGCRPEIKIPPNPMANLRPTPKPQPKDDFWVEEYRKERSKSPLAPQQSNNVESNHDTVDRPIQKLEETSRPEMQKPQISQKPSSPVSVAPPMRPSPVRSSSPPMTRPMAPPSPARAPQPLSPVKIPQQEPPMTVYNNIQKEPSPVRVIKTQRAPSPVKEAPPNRNAQLGSLYIPPVQDQMANRQHLLNQQTPPWMQSRQAGQKEIPEWANREEQFNRQQQQQLLQNQQQQQPQMQPMQPMQQTSSASNPRERIIPIQLEQTPTPTKSPTTPGFGPQPYYNNTAQQYSSVQSPPTTYSSPTYPYNNPNQFVDQGYNNINFTAPAQAQSWNSNHHQQQPSGQRIIPIQMEGQSPENSYPVRGPVNQQPTVIRSDPRSPPTTPQQQPQWGQPNQSKSFRILQKLTDTIADGNNSEEDAGPAELQQPHFSRPLGPADMNENQLRKLQLTENDKALMNRVKNQVDQETYLHSEEDPRYRGAAIPSKAFKLLQNMTDGGQAYDNQVPMHRANPRFAQQRAMFQPNEGENQVYIHPSEQQQMPEPKIYTGSAIPSRSFKMLQAMTTPENAAEGTDASDIEDHNFSPIPYPYPYYYDPHFYYPPQSPMTVPPPDGVPFWGGYYPPPPPPQGYAYYPYYGYPPFYGPPPFVPISRPESEERQARKTPSLRRTPSIVVTPTPEDQPDNTWSEDLRKNLSGSDKRYSGDDEKMTNEDSEDEESSSSSSATEKGHELVQSPSKSGLQAIKSVTDINVYANEEEEDEYDVEEVTNEEAQDTDCEEEIIIDDDQIIPHQLSVIYEESERSKNRHSQDDTETGSTFSDTSTTIACEDEDEPQDKNIKDMVTVRLPLKLSYSRTSNDEEITTVQVGNSETTRNSSDADISVTVSIPSRASSIDRNGLSETPSLERKNSGGFEFEEESSDISVNVSLPMKRDKFFGNTHRSGTCNDISMENDEDKDEDETEYEYVSESEDEIVIELSAKEKYPLATIESEPEEAEETTEYEEVTEYEEAECEEESKNAVPAIKTAEKQNDSESEDSSEEEETEYETEDESETEGVVVRKITYIEERITHHGSFSPKLFPLEINDPPEPQMGNLSYMKEDTPEKFWFDEEPKCFKKIKEDSLESKSPIFWFTDDIKPTSKNQNDSLKAISPVSWFTDDVKPVSENMEDAPKSKSPTFWFEEESKIHEDDIATSVTTLEEQQPEDSPSMKVKDLVKKFEDEKEESEDEEESEESEDESDEDSKPVTPEPIPSETLPISETEDENKVSVKERIAAFETVSTAPPTARPLPVRERLLVNASHRSSIEESADDDDSGVTSDISRPLSDTESENFPELRKMSRYQRAATHSRLFKLLQEDGEDDKIEEEEEKPLPAKAYKPKKIVHNVSITRKTNPNAVSEAETMEDRRKRLSLPLEKSASLDQESMSSSSTSPTSSGVNEKLVSELVQSLLMQKRGRMLRNVPIEKLHAAAKRVLLEDADFDSVMGSSQEDTTVDSTPALTPQEFTYPDYYESWSDADDQRYTYDIVPSKAFRTLQEQSLTGQRKSWAARCPRVLSSKTVNRDLSRVAEIRESESPEVTPPPTSARSTPSSCDLKPGRSRTPMSGDTGVH